jgi:hypothetical protein
LIIRRGERTGLPRLEELFGLARGNHEQIGLLCGISDPAGRFPPPKKYIFSLRTIGESTLYSGPLIRAGRKKIQIIMIPAINFFG